MEAKQLLKDVAGPSDNLVNLFEIPVLFYVALIILYVTDFSSVFYLVLAWAFVLLRYAHSLIHVTYNRVMHRFAVYFAGTLLLWVIWAILGGEQSRDHSNSKFLLHRRFSVSVRKAR